MNFERIIAERIRTACNPTKEKKEESGERYWETVNISRHIRQNEYKRQDGVGCRWNLVPRRDYRVCIRANEKEKQREKRSGERMSGTDIAGFRCFSLKLKRSRLHGNAEFHDLSFLFTAIPLLSFMVFHPGERTALWRYRRCCSTIFIRSVRTE